MAGMSRQSFILNTTQRIVILNETKRSIVILNETKWSEESHDNFARVILNETKWSEESQRHTRTRDSSLRYHFAQNDRILMLGRSGE
jgi:PHD/YefM family antitoxin component YafN of YafNO toxin-antitoxin module